jgi:hypothetical protein
MFFDLSEAENVVLRAVVIALVAMPPHLECHERAELFVSEATFHCGLWPGLKLHFLAKASLKVASVATELKHLANFIFLLLLKGVSNDVKLCIVV